MLSAVQASRVVVTILASVKKDKEKEKEKKKKKRQLIIKARRFCFLEMYNRSISRNI